METKKVALVTGASSGIGVEFARLLAEQGYDLVLTARREGRLRKLAEELELVHGVVAKPLVADLANPDSAQRIFEQTRLWNMHVEVLVNNAGFGVYDKFAKIDDGQNFSMIQVMVTSLTELCRLFVRPMLRRGQGGIINVASIGSEIPVPGCAVYAASKAYVTHFTESLNLELVGTGVQATVLLPGATRTEWMEVAGMEETKMIQRVSMSARSVAKVGLRAFARGRTKVIAGCTNWLQIRAMRFLPRLVVSRILAFYTT